MTKINHISLFRIATVCLLVFGISLVVLGYVLRGSLSEGGADFRLRWCDVQHVFHRINPANVSTGECDGLENAKFSVPISGYPPWSHVIGFVFVPPIPMDYSLVVFSFFQALALLIICLLIYSVTRNRSLTDCFPYMFVGLFLSLPGVCTDIKWGNYTLISLCFLAISIILCERRNNTLSFVAGFCYSIAFVKPQLAALFGLFFLIKGYWRVWSIAGFFVLLYTLITSFLVKETPWALTMQVFRQMTVVSPNLNSYLVRYNYGLLDILKIFNIPLSVVSKLNFFIGIICVVLLYVKYRKYVTLLAQWAIPATFTTMWTYNNKYDWIIIFFLLFSFGVYALETKSVNTRRNIICFVFLSILSICLTAKLVWFGYVINCYVQLFIRLIWLTALIIMLHWQKREFMMKLTSLDGVAV